MTLTARQTRGAHVFVQGILKGHIFWTSVKGASARGAEQNHENPSPWLVVSSSSIHCRLPIVLAVPLTSQFQQEESGRNHRIRILGDHVRQLPLAPGARPVSGDILVLTEQLRALAHERLLGDPVAKVTPQALLYIEAGLKHVLGMA